MFRVICVSSFRASSSALVQRSAATRCFHGSAALRNKTVKLQPTQIVVSAFNRLDGADDAANTLIEALNSGGTELGISCHNLCILRKNDANKAKITEMGKIKKRHGAVVGALTAGASVLLAGPIVVAGGTLGGALGAAAAGGAARAGALYGAVAAAEGTLLAHLIATASGAMTGAYAASKIETLNPEKLDALGNILQPQQSALIAVFDSVPIPMDMLNAEMQATRDEIISQIGSDIGATLKQGKDVAYWMAADEENAEGLIATRMVTGDDAIDVMALVVAAEDPLAFGDSAFDGPEKEVIEYEVVDGEVVVDPSSEEEEEKRP